MRFIPVQKYSSSHKDQELEIALKRWVDRIESLGGSVERRPNPKRVVIHPGKMSPDSLNRIVLQIKGLGFTVRVD